ncbi:MAG: hypothetical protein AAAB35_28545 [Phyllobacterium sp.]|uniref:hypothetical protein n=1 Tax=Phyllobacterium sp. TaxID=1871046 RepID=UPI0030F02A84
MTSDIASAPLVQSLLAGLDIRSGTARESPRVPHNALSAIDQASKRVEEARRAADASLMRAKAAPRPHEITNPVFVALFDAHQQDREALFAAMRTLDAARSNADTDELD